MLKIIFQKNARVRQCFSGFVELVQIYGKTGGQLFFTNSDFKLLESSCIPIGINVSCGKKIYVTLMIFPKEGK